MSYFPSAAGIAHAIAARTVYLTGTGATHTFQLGISCADIEGCAEGGGGGGAGADGANAGYGSGGAAGGYFRKRVTAGLTTATYTVGSGSGTGGAAGSVGGTGADTIVVANGVTYTAKGGLGGGGMSQGTTVRVAQPSAGVAGTNGDILFPGMAGRPGIRLSGTVGCGGGGGSSLFGSGGAPPVDQGQNNATGNGAGGSGASATAANQVGGNATGGIVVITEYY